MVKKTNKKVKPNIHVLLGVIVMVAGLMLLTFVNITVGIILIVLGAAWAIIATVKKKK